MGLPLRNPNSFSLTSGAAPPGGPSDFGPDSEDVDSTSEPSCYRNGLRSPLHLKQRPRRAGGVSVHRHDTDATTIRNSVVSRTTKNNARQNHNHQRKAEHLRVAPRRYRYPCAFDTEEARELAHSAARLPGEQPQHQCHALDGRDPGRRRSHSPSTSTSTSPNRSRTRSASLSSRSRPPSLERQDAFRDEKTVKRRQLSPSPSSSWSSDMDVDPVEEEDASYLVRMEKDEEEGARYLAEMERREEEEVAELYRIGLLYDDEYERGEGFSLGAIVREEPVYLVRRERRPARRRGQHERKGGAPVSLSLDLAFSAFGEDDVVSAVSAYDFLDSVSVSEMSYCQPDVNEDSLAWMMRDACNEEEEDAPRATAAPRENDVDPWVVLGRDGS